MSSIFGNQFSEIFGDTIGQALEDVVDGKVDVPPMTLKPRGRGKAAKTMALIDAAYKILQEIQPASVRAVCYRLFVAGLITSMSKAETNRVSKQLVYARENRVIPWDWIVDETRTPEMISAWSSPLEIFEIVASSYRYDYWQHQPLRIEVWSEKGTVRGTLAPVLRQYGVTLRVMHGHASATTVNDVAEMSCQSDKPLTVLYVGDWDPSGLHMSEIDLPRRLDLYGGKVHLWRVAITEGDIEALPSFAAKDKKEDPRYLWWCREQYGNRCVELDALPPNELRKRVEESILARLDMGAWMHARKVEDVQRDSTQKYVDGLAESISRQASKYSGTQQ